MDEARPLCVCVCVCVCASISLSPLSLSVNVSLFPTQLGLPFPSLLPICPLSRFLQLSFSLSIPLSFFSAKLLVVTITLIHLPNCVKGAKKVLQYKLF